MLWFATATIVSGILSQILGIESTRGPVTAAIVIFIFAAPLVLTAMIDARMAASAARDNPTGTAAQTERAEANVAVRIIGVVALTFAGLLVVTAAVFVLPLFLAIVAIWCLGMVSVGSAVVSAISDRK